MTLKHAVIVHVVLVFVIVTVVFSIVLTVVAFAAFAISSCGPLHCHYRYIK